MKIAPDAAQLASLQAVFGARVPDEVGAALTILDASPAAPADAAARAALRAQVVALAGQRLDDLRGAAEALGRGAGDARTQRAMPAGVAVQIAQLQGAPIPVVQPELTEAQRAVLALMGVRPDDVPLVATGQEVVVVRGNPWDDDTIGTVQVAGDHVKAAIVSVHAVGHGLAIMSSFRQDAFEVARAFEKPEIELGGAAVINGKIEALLKRQAFEATVRPVPDDLGDDGDMEMFVKRMKVPAPR